MVNNWLKFNENLVSSLDIIKEHFQTIRSCLMEFEDNDLISEYKFGLFTENALHPSWPNIPGLDIYNVYKVDVVDGFCGDTSNFYNKYRKFGLPEEKDDNIKKFLNVTIKTDVMNGFMKSDGMNIFDILLDSNGKLISEGYETTLEINTEDKFLRFKIYFK